MFKVFTFIYSSFTGIYDQLSVGLIAQLVEHCTGIAEPGGGGGGLPYGTDGDARRKF